MGMVRGVALPFLLLFMVACGSPGVSQSASGTQGASASASESTAASASEQDEPSSAPPTSGGDTGDLDSLVQKLKPPNATEISKTSAQGGAYVAWESTDSADSLKSFYEKAIKDAGMTVFSTTTTGGVLSWIFAKEEGSSFGGSVTVAPSTSGGSGSSVIVAVTGP